MVNKEAETNGVLPLSDEDVEKASGGSFFSNGGTWSSDSPHYLIVTAFHSCRDFVSEDGKGDCCLKCVYSHYSFPTLYCHHRTFDNDPCA